MDATRWSAPDADGADDGPWGWDGLAPSKADRAAERRLREEIRAEVGRELSAVAVLLPAPADEERVRRLIRERIARHQHDAANRNEPLLADPEGLARRLFDRLLGLGPLDPLVRDPRVEEILVNAFGRVFVVVRGRWRLAPHVYFEDDAEVKALCKRLAGRAGRRLDESSPMVDAALPDGSRLNVVIAPISEWTVLSLRKFLLKARTLAELIERRMLSEELARFFAAAVQGGASIVVSGQTATGKCVTGDTLVTLADGQLVPIRALVEQSFTGKVLSEDRDGWACAPISRAPMTCDFERGAIRPAASATAWRHRAPETLIEVVTRTGKRVRVTPEHPFFTTVAGEVVQVRADRLHAGDRIAVCASIATAGALPALLDLLSSSSALYVADAADVVRDAVERIRAAECLPWLKDVFSLLGLPWSAGRCWRSINAVPLSAFRRICVRAGIRCASAGGGLCLKSRTGRRVVRLADPIPAALTRFAGLVVGDGHVGGPYVDLTSGEPEVRRDFADLCLELFGVRPLLRPGRSRCPTLVLGSSVAVEILSLVYGVPSGAKARSVRAPAWLMAAPQEHIAAYLSGLLDTDGSVVRRKSRGRAPNVEFWTSSPGLAEDIVALLLRLGVRSHLQARKRGLAVHVFDAAGVLRLREVLALAHPDRRAALETSGRGTGFSNVDVIPGLAEPLRQARQAAGMSYSEAARAYGVSNSLPKMYERGQRHPTRTRVLDLARRMWDPVLAARLSAVAAQPVFWDRVVSVTRLPDHGEEYVYDLTVPGTHTFLVGSGGIVAHNTTFLNALGACLAPVAASRTITIEETRELALQKILPNCVALQARPPNLEGAGEVRIRDLVRNALRMRPDVIVVGEVRGGECWDMLQALNTGHAGCMSTVHANSPRDALERIVDLSMMADERPSAEVATRMVARAIELVVQLRFDRDGVRRVASVFEVTGLEGATIAGNELWTHDPESDRLVWTGIRPRCLEKIAARGIPYALPSALEARP